MGTATDQIKMSATVERALAARRREDESCNDVLERILADDRNLFAGFGAFDGTNRAETMRSIHNRGAQAPRERIDEMVEDRTDE